MKIPIFSISKTLLFCCDFDWLSSNSLNTIIISVDTVLKLCLFLNKFIFNQITTNYHSTWSQNSTGWFLEPMKQPYALNLKWEEPKVHKGPQYNFAPAPLVG